MLNRYLQNILPNTTKKKDLYSVLKTNNVIISIDTEKAFNKVQHYSMLKPQKKAGIQGSYFNVKRAAYDKIATV